MGIEYRYRVPTADQYNVAPSALRAMPSAPNVLWGNGLRGSIGKRIYDFAPDNGQESRFWPHILGPA